MAVSPGSLEALRRRNRLHIIEILQQQGRASRAEISRATGLSRTAVSTLVGQLLADGIVVERDDEDRQAPSPNGGRPPTLLSLDPSSGGFAGIYFAHDSVRAIVVDRSGTTLADARAELDVDHQPAEAVRTSVGLVADLLGRVAMRQDRLAGIGVALSAPLRGGAGELASPRIFPHWGEVDVAHEIGSRLGGTVHVGNDANLGGLAEATVGAGRGTSNLVYVMLSAGVGSALILDGKLYEGQTGTAGELGHMVVEPDGAICRCGNRGCLETVASSAALSTALNGAHGSALAFSDLLGLLERRDPAALRALADAGRAVGRALAAACTMLDPGMVVVGGELAAGGEALLDGIRETLDRETSATGHGYPVVRGELGPTAEVLGAALLAMRSAAFATPLERAPIA